MSDQRIDLAEALRRILDSRLADVHVALPGKVTRYDLAGGVVDVQPMVRRAVPDQDGETVLEDLPVVPSVPVCFPSGGGCSISFPIAVGDHVQILFNERDLDRYRASGGDLSDPGVLSTHGLSGAVALPVSIKEAADADGTHVKVALSGSKELHVGGDSDAAALASKVKELEAWAEGHIHTTTATVGTGSVGVISIPTSTASLSYDSAKLKVDG